MEKGIVEFTQLFHQKLITFLSVFFQKKNPPLVIIYLKVVDWSQGVSDGENGYWISELKSQKMPQRLLSSPQDCVQVPKFEFYWLPPTNSHRISPSFSHFSTLNLFFFLINPFLLKLLHLNFDKHLRENDGVKIDTFFLLQLFNTLFNFLRLFENFSYISPFFNILMVFSSSIQLTVSGNLRIFLKYRESNLIFNFSIKNILEFARF